MKEQGKSMKKLFAVMVTLLLLAACDLLGGDHLQKAREYARAGKLKAAVIEYKNVLRQDPANSDARLALGELYLKMGDSQGAEKELRRAAQAHPDDAGLKLRLVRALVMGGHNDKAGEILDDLVKQGRLPHPEGDVLRATVLAGLDRVDEAEGLYRSVLEREPDNDEATLGLARVLASKKHFSEASELVGKVLARHPEQTDARLLQGNLDLFQNRFDEALEAFRAAWRNGQDPNVLRSIQARFGIVEALLSLGREQDALTHVDALIKRLPNHPMPHYWRARIAYTQGDMGRALDELLQVVRVQPDHPQSNQLLGAIYYKQGNLVQAEHYLQKYVAVVPADIPSRKLLAAVRLRLKTPDLALKTLDPLLSDEKQDPQLLALAGNAALHKGDVAAGVRYLKKALALDPDNPGLRTELGMAYLSRGDTGSAITELKGVVAKGDKEARAQTLLVLAHLRDRHFGKARQVVQGMIDKGDHPALAQSLLALVARAQGRLDEAANAYTRALEADPKYIPALLDFARLESQRGRLSEARRKYDSVLALEEDNLDALLGEARLAARQGDEKAALEWLEKARSSHPRSLPPRLVLGRYYLNARLLEKAKPVVAEAQAIAPDDSSVLLLAGQFALASGSAQDAVRLFSRVVRGARRSPQAHFDLARAYIITRQNDRARTELHEALRLEPGFAPASELLARLEIQSGRTDAARKAIASLRARKGGDEVADILEGDLLSRQGAYKKALAVYRKVLAANPDDRDVFVRIYLTRRRMKDPDAYRSLQDWLSAHPDDHQARLVLASNLLSRGLHRQAIRQYERLLEETPRDSVVLNNLAWLYDQTGDPRAIETARKAYESKPEDGAVVDTYAWMLVEHGDLDQGLPLLEKAYELSSDNRDIRYHLGVAYARKGESRRARRLLDAMRGNPLEAEHAKALAALIKE